MNTTLGFLEKLHFLHRCYRYKFRTEKQQLAKLSTYPLKGKVAFDVGGNHGIYVYWLSKAVGLAGQVHVFEPQPELGEEIRHVAHWLKLGQVRVNVLALSAQTDEKVLRRTRVGDGSATLDDHVHNPSGSQNLKVKTLSLDHYCQQKAVSDLGFIKIDVEGHELSVIQGGLESLRQFKPIIQVELRVHEPSCDQVIHLLTDLGYTGVMLCDGREVSLNDYKTVPSRKHGLMGHRDFVFEPLESTA